jgi:AcrR family transcriptional regulator
MATRVKPGTKMKNAGADAPSRTRRQPGRPMSEDVERRLLDAALSVLIEHGVGGLTVDKIADAAGVPRTTFYRRWQTANEAVAAAAKDALGAANPEDPATGDFREDLTIMGKNMVRLLNRGHFARVLSFMIAEMQFNPAFRATTMELVRYRRQYPASVLQRAQEAGQVSRDLDAELLVEMYVGAMFFRLFFGEAPPDDAYVSKLLDMIIGGRGFGKAASRTAEARKPATARRNTKR